MTRRTKREIWTLIYEQVLQKNALRILFFSSHYPPLILFRSYGVCYQFISSLLQRSLSPFPCVFEVSFHFLFVSQLIFSHQQEICYDLSCNFLTKRSPFCPFFFAYKLGQIISLFFSFPFISEYKFCVMLYYKYLKMKIIKIIYSLCFCFNLGKDMNSLPGSKTQPHCKYYTRKENFHVNVLENAL